MLAVGLITAPRAQDTLVESIRSFRRAGFHEGLTVFAEPGAVVSGVDDARWNESRLGPLGNFKQAIRTLLAETREPWLLVLEDDVVWAPGSADVLRAACAAHDPTTTGFLTPYTSERNLDRSVIGAWTRDPATAPRGWHRLGLRGAFWGALALCLPRQSAESILAYQTTADGADTAAGEFFRRNRFALSCYTHLPSLCDHIGATSAISPEHDGNRDSAVERGRRGFMF